MKSYQLPGIYVKESGQRIVQLPGIAWKDTTSGGINSTTSGDISNIILETLLGESSFTISSTSSGSLDSFTLNSLTGEGNSTSSSLGSGNLANLSLNSISATISFTRNVQASGSITGIFISTLSGFASISGEYPSVIQDIGEKTLSLAPYNTYDLTLTNELGLMTLERI